MFIWANTLREATTLAICHASVFCTVHPVCRGIAHDTWHLARGTLAHPPPCGEQSVAR